MDDLLIIAEDVTGEILLLLLFAPAPIMSTVSAFLIGKRTRWYLGLIVFIPLNFTLVYLTFLLITKFTSPVRQFGG